MSTNKKVLRKRTGIANGRIKIDEEFDRNFDVMDKEITELFHSDNL